MATRRMLVDAIHPEETRVVVTNGNRLEEFDFESAARQQLRGNIYLAKVTRVEPSLQAAFIEYGGNRHGFLAFSEIHPDYYQIPVADREALLREEEDEAEREQATSHASDSVESDEVPQAGEESEAQAQEAAADQSSDSDAEAGVDDANDTAEIGDIVEAGADSGNIEDVPHEHEAIESLGGSDAIEEEVPQRRRTPARRYKIQEVIKRRQVMLVQVVKEERGNKGAALTTYLSLAGRYSVLMPNTSRGGGISRKITNAADRKRLKEITSDLEVPKGMGVILRTAGASRTKQEVKRDFEYLMRLWESVRSLTLRSEAPCLVYEEGSLIKRTIRDLYSKEIDEIHVAGDAAFREAKDFMRMIMPSAANDVQLYRDDQPLFSKFNIEQQLDQMFSPTVTLPSGGYIVINPTEALVSIDVNSGRSTREHNIEDTALQTNLEACEEVARQLRLRDLAGLIVIDFIDMVENRSNRAVERKLKDCLKNDRARIQVGRISHFGLMEMSRQRIRQGVIESSTHKCEICNGTGLVRSVESLALMVMRQIEETVLRRPGQSINVRVPTDVALYLLNSKRNALSALEDKHALSITVIAETKILGEHHFAIEKGEPRLLIGGETKPVQHVSVDLAVMDDLDDADEAAVASAEISDDEEPAGAESEGETGRRRRRRRRRGGERGDAQARQQQTAPSDVVNGMEGAPDEDISAEGDPDAASEASASVEESDENRKRRRRGRRGGRRNRREGEDAQLEAAAETGDGDTGAGTTELELAAEVALDEAAVLDDAPPVMDAEPAQGDTAEISAPDAAIAAEPAADEAAEAVPAKPRRTRRTKAQIAAEAAAADGSAPAAVSEAVDAEDAPKPRRRTRRTKADEQPATATPESPEAQSPAPPEAAPPQDETATLQPEPVEPTPEPAGTDVAANSDDDASGEAEEQTARPRRELPPEGVINVSSSSANPEGEPKKRGGWWQRRLLGS